MNEVNYEELPLLKSNFIKVLKYPEQKGGREMEFFQMPE